MKKLKGKYTHDELKKYWDSLISQLVGMERVKRAIDKKIKETEKRCDEVYGLMRKSDMEKKNETQT